MKTRRGKPIGYYVLHNFEEIAASLAFWGIFVGQSFQVFSRYVLQSPLTWTEELSRILFIWLGFLGSVIVTKHGGHLSVDLITGRLPDAARGLIGMFVQGVVVVFLVVITYYGLGITFLARRTATPAMQISVAFIYAPVPVFGVLTIVRILGRYRQKKRADRWITRRRLVERGAR